MQVASSPFDFDGPLLMTATTPSSKNQGGQSRPRSSLSKILRWGGLVVVLVNFISVLIYVYVNEHNPSAISIEYISSLIEPSRSSCDTEVEADDDLQEFSSSSKYLVDIDSLPHDSVDRVAFVTFSYVTHRDAHKLFEFLLPAVDTWAAPIATSTRSRRNSYASESSDARANNRAMNESALFDDEENEMDETINEDSSTTSRPTLYVVFSHTSREPFEHYCLHQQGGITPQQFTLCQYIQPIYVDCPEGKFGESPCCKQQKGLLQLYEGATRNKNNNTNSFSLYDWYAFFDDDAYLRKQYIAKILAVLKPSSFPMVGIPYNQDAKDVGFGVKNCGGNNGNAGRVNKENIKIRQVGNGRYKFSSTNNRKDDNKQFRYPWGMPVFYSRGALDMLSKGFRANSLVKQCMAFDITHDVGNAMLHWMYRLPAARLPPFQPLPDVRDDFIGSHWVGREDMRINLFSAEKLDRNKYSALKDGAFSFYKTHETWMLTENEPPKIEELSTVNDDKLKWYTPNVTGFEQTRTYARYGNPETWEEGVWHTMRMRDCN